MKNIIFIALFSFLTNNLFSQAISNQVIEKDLQLTYERILSDRLNPDADALVKRELANKEFKEKLFKYVSSNPNTLTYNFDSLRKLNIKIITSNDNLFRIYSWDTWLGGTMSDFDNIYQYKSTNSTIVKLQDDINQFRKSDYTPFYSQIFTLATNNKTYYLAINNGIYSSKDASQSIKVYAIDNNMLVDTIKLFKTNSNVLNEINVYFDFFSVVDRSERPLRLIKYNTDKKKLYIPIVLENGKVTKRYIIYKFTGKYFELVSNQKNRKYIR